MADGNAVSLLAGIDEHLRRKRARQAVEEIRLFSVHPRIDAVSTALRAIENLKVSESESEENKAVRAAYEMVSAAFHEGAAPSAFVQVVDQLVRNDVNDTKSLARRLHAMQLLAIIYGLLTSTHRERFLAAVLITLKECMPALTSSDAAISKLPSKARKFLMSQLFSVSSALTSLRCVIQRDTAVIDAMDMSVLSVLPAGVLHKNVDIRRASCLVLKSVCVASSNALSRCRGREHEEAHARTQWAANLIRAARSGRMTSPTALHADADCSFLKACQIIAGVPLTCACSYKTELGSDTLSDVVHSLNDPRPRVALAAVSLLAEFGLGSLLRYFHLSPMAGSHAWERVNGVCATMIQSLVSHGFAALTSGSAPLIAAVTRTASACGRAFMLFECACSQALSMRPGSLFCPKLVKLVKARNDDLGSSCLAVCRFITLEMLRLIDLAAACLVFCVSSGNVAYKHPALLSLEAMMGCCSLDVLVALSGTSVRSYLSGSYAIRVRAAMRAVTAAFADAATRYSAEAVLQLHHIVVEKVKAYSRIMPALQSLPECLTRHWQTSADANYPSMVSWKFSNTMLPLRAHSLAPVVALPTSLLHTTCADQRLRGLYARNALLSGQEFPLRVVHTGMTQLLSAVGATDFAGTSSLLVFGGTCPSVIKLDSLLASLRVHPKQLVINSIFRAQICDASTSSVRVREKIVGVILAIYDEYSNAAGQLMSKFAKHRKLRDEPFGIGTTKVMYPALVTKVNPIIVGIPILAGVRDGINLQCPSSAQGHIDAAASQSSNKQVVSALYSSARQPLSLTVIDPDFVDSSKLAAERLIRRLHRCIGSFVIASTSLESTAMLPVR